MPELPDLVHVAGRLSGEVVGKQIVSARAGDPVVLRVMVPDPFPQALVGGRIVAVERRGHFLRFATDRDLLLVINAMLVGKYALVERNKKKDPRSMMFALELEDGRELRYSDEKRMGKVYVVRPADEGTIPVYGKLGVDLAPGGNLTLPAFRKLIAKRRDQVRNFLMDKQKLASIGNAYADEILFAAKLHPKTFCNKLSEVDVERLFEAIGEVLGDAIAEIRRRNPPIDRKLRDFVKVRGRTGKPCPVCGDTIRAVRVGAGDACFCPTCQPSSRKLFIDWQRPGRG